MSFIGNFSFNIGIVAELRNLEFYQISLLTKFLDFDSFFKNIGIQSSFNYTEVKHRKEYDTTWIMFISMSFKAIINAFGYSFIIKIGVFLISILNLYLKCK